MTIPLKPKMTLALVAVFCVLIGLVAGQLANANSEKAQTSAAGTGAIVSQLKQINTKLGATYSSSSALGMLDDIKGSTKATQDAHHSELVGILQSLKPVK
jgi:hypothetical protein